MSATLHDAVLGALTLKQCTQSTLSPGNVISAGRASADVGPSALYLEKGDPRATFTSADVAGVLAAVDPSAGLAVSSGTITIPYRVRANFASFVSGANNVSISGANALIIPTQVSVTDGQAATAGLEVAFVSTDGETSPIAFNTGVTVSSPSFNAEYRLYPPTLDGSAIAGVTGWSANFGLTVTSDGDEDGYTFPRSRYIEMLDPTIDVTVRDQSLIGTHGPLFSAMSAAVFRLRKKDPYGTVVATSTGAHITLTFADGIKDVQQVSASGNSRGETTFRLYGEALTVSTTATL